MPGRALVIFPDRPFRSGKPKVTLASFAPSRFKFISDSNSPIKMNNTMLFNKASLPYKIFLVLIAVLCLTACKQVHQPPPLSKTGRMLEIEIRIPEPWQHIIIGPTQQKEYPKVSNRFSIFMNVESTGTLKPYLNVSFEISQLSQQHPIEYIGRNLFGQGENVYQYLQ